MELIVADYDRIGSSDPIGRVLLGYNRKSLELKHWKEMIENPRRPIVHWHVLKVIKYCLHLSVPVISSGKAPSQFRNKFAPFNACMNLAKATGRETCRAIFFLFHKYSSTYDFIHSIHSLLSA